MAEDGHADNVVPFPGDWIGPRDELVPIAMPGDSEERPAAEAFWSESSEAIHSLLTAPDADRRERRECSREIDRHRPRRARIGWSRPPGPNRGAAARRVIVAGLPPSAVSRAVALGRRPQIAALAIAALCALAVALSAVGRPPSTRTGGHSSARALNSIADSQSEPGFHRPVELGSVSRPATVAPRKHAAPTAGRAHHARGLAGKEDFDVRSAQSPSNVTTNPVAQQTDQPVSPGPIGAGAPFAPGEIG